MSKKDEALKLALEALEYYEHRKIEWDYSDEFAITAIREALAEQQAAEQEQEPVAERHERRVEAHNNVYATEVTVDRLLFLARQGLHSEGDTVGWYEAYFAIDRLFELAKPPAQQPLTDEQRSKMYRAAQMRGDSIMMRSDYELGITDAEAAHGIKGDA
jgi:hypothetical protein